MCVCICSTSGAGHDIEFRRASLETPKSLLAATVCTHDRNDDRRGSETTRDRTTDKRRKQSSQRREHKHNFGGTAMVNGAAFDAGIRLDRGHVVHRSCEYIPFSIFYWIYSHFVLVISLCRGWPHPLLRFVTNFRFVFFLSPRRTAVAIFIRVNIYILAIGSRVLT